MDYINTCQHKGLTHQGHPRKALLKVLVTCIALGVFALPQNTERSAAALTFLGIRLDLVQLTADLLANEVACITEDFK